MREEVEQGGKDGRKGVAKERQASSLPEVSRKWEKRPDKKAKRRQEQNRQREPKGQMRRGDERKRVHAAGKLAD